MPGTRRLSYGDGLSFGSLGSLSFGGGFSSRQPDITAPFMPSPDQIAAAQEAAQQEDESGGGFFGFIASVFQIPERLLGIQSLKALIAGDAEQAVMNNPLFQITDAVGITNVTKYYDAARIRESLGDTNAREGIGNFLINTSIDILSDPGTYLMPFAKVAEIGKMVPGAANNIAQGVLSQAVESGTRAMFVWKVPFTQAGFAHGLPKSMDLAVARGLEKVANFLNSNPITGTILKATSPAYGPNMVDVLDETGNVVVAGSQLRRTAKSALNMKENAEFAYMGQFMPVLNHLSKTPIGRLMMTDSDVGKAVMTAIELNIRTIDDYGQHAKAIRSGVPYARGVASRDRLLSTSPEAIDLARRMGQGDLTAVTKWMEKYPKATLPEEGIDFAKSVGAARNDVDLGIDLRGLEGSPIDVQVLQAVEDMPGAATQGIIDRAKDTTEVGRIGREVLQQAKQEELDLFARIAKRTDVTPENILEAANAGRALMERIGQKDVLSGLLNGMLELYTHRRVTPEVAKIINDRFMSGVKSFGGDAAEALAASFMKGRGFTDLTTVEANVIAREIGTRYTGFQPLGQLANGGAEQAEGVLAKIFDMPFLRGLRGVEGAEDVAELLSTNPMLSWYQRIRSGARVTGELEFNKIIFADDSPFVLAKGALKDLTQEAISRNTGQGLRAFLVDKSKKLFKPSGVSATKLVTGVMGDDLAATKAIARDAVRDWTTEAMFTRKMDDAQVIQALDDDIAIGEKAGEELLRATPYSSGGVLYHKALKDIDDEIATIRALEMDVADAKSARFDASTLRSEAQAEVTASRRAIKALRERESAMRKTGNPLHAKYADESAAAAKQQEDMLVSLEKDLADARGLGKLAERARERIRKDITDRRQTVNAMRDKAESYKAALREEIADIREARDEFMKGAKDGAKNASAAINKAVSQKLAKHRFAEELAFQRKHRETGAVALDELAQSRPDILEAIKKRHGDTEVIWMDAKVSEDVLGKDGILNRMRRPDTPGRLLRGIDGATWWWKAWTTLNPVFINSRVRDVLGASWLMDMAGAGGATKQVIPGLGDAAQVTASVAAHMRGETAALAGKKVFGPAGQSLTHGEFLDKMQAAGLVNSGLAADEILRTGEAITFAGTKKGGEFKKKFFTLSARKSKIIDAGYKMAELGDNHAKIAGVLARWRTTGNLDEAVDFVKGWSYNPASQNLLTSFERHRLRRVIPFYSFAKFAVTKTAELAVMRPGTMAWFDKVGKNASQAVGLTPDELDMAIPEFIRDNLGIPVTRDAEGNPLYFTFGNFHPAADLFKLAKAVQDSFDSESDGKGSIVSYVGEKLHPALRVPLERMTGKSFFGQRRLEAYPGESVEFLGLPMKRKTADLWRTIRFLNEIDRIGFFSSEDAKSMIRTQDGMAMNWLTGGMGFISARLYTPNEMAQLRMKKAQQDANYSRLKGQLRKTLQSGEGGKVDAKNVRTLQELLAKAEADRQTREQLEAVQASRTLTGQ
jgi:hypothetical protein